MTETVLNVESQLKRKRSILKAFFISFPMVFLLAVLTFGSMGEKQDSIILISRSINFIFFSGLFFLMIYSGKTSKYRTILYVLGAFSFVLNFIANSIAARGTMLLTESTIFSGETPFCHLVIPMIIIPAALTKTVIFPGNMLEGFASIGSMVIIWAGASITLGRGWCSWVCFFGGLDEGFSKLCRKPRFKIDKRWTILPVAVLLAVMLLASVLLRAVYCEWLCPFAAVTEFEPVVNIKTFLQATIFISLFLILVVILPVLTGKRTQCSLFCPFAALQSLMNKINIFEMRIDRSKCTDCGKCVRLCPTLSIDNDSVKKGRTLMTCTKCGRCSDECPKDAIAFHIKGTPIGIAANKARIIFLYAAFIFASLFIGSNISGALSKFIKLAVTGSMI